METDPVARNLKVLSAHAEQQNGPLQTWSIPQSGDSMAALTVTNPLTAANYELIVKWLMTMRAALVDADAQGTTTAIGSAFQAVQTDRPPEIRGPLAELGRSDVQVNQVGMEESAKQKLLESESDEPAQQKADDPAPQRG